MAAIIVTTLPLFGSENQILVADVLGANPTATTFLVNCAPGTDGNDCGTYNETVVIGPWAKATPPPEASTGVYDLTVSMDTEFFFHVHCDMSKTVAVQCTTTNLGGNDNGSPTATYTSLKPTDAFALDYLPVTITHGLDILASATASAGSSSTSGGAADTTVLTGSAASSSSVTGTGTRTAATTTPTSAAMRGQGVALAGTLALTVLVMSWCLR